MLGGTRSGLSLTIPQYWALSPPCTLPSSLCILRWFSLPAGKKHYPLPCVEASTVISNPFRLFSNRHVLIDTQILEEGLLQTSSVISLHSSLLFPMNPACLGLLRFSTPSPEQEVCWVHMDASLWSVLKDRELKHLGSPWLFLVYHISVVTRWLNYKLLFCMLYLFF